MGIAGDLQRGLQRGCLQRGCLQETGNRKEINGGTERGLAAVQSCLQASLQNCLQRRLAAAKRCLQRSLKNCLQRSLLQSRKQKEIFGGEFVKLPAA